ncbi:MAG: CHAD domain-containing protein [Gallionella sp.]
MTVETELKLRINPEHLAKLRRHALLRELQIAPPRTHKLYSIYYDTPAMDLHKSAMALRMRRDGRNWMQTLKGGGSVNAGLHRRNEWEVPVKSGALDFDMPLDDEWHQHLPKSLRKKLKPVFVTDFSRNSRMLMWKGAQIELCIDHGLVTTERDNVNLCELELELKSGESRQLFELALALLEIVPFELETVSKAERGYRLLSGHVDRPCKAVAVEVCKRDSLSEILQAQIWSCVAHFQSNLAGALQVEDAEYLHQARVALRRMRVLLRMTEQLKADRQLSELVNAISALGVVLGRIRDLDVFIADTLHPMCCSGFNDDTGLKTLLSLSMRQRTSLLRLLNDEARSGKFERLTLGLAMFLSGPYWGPHEFPHARDFATDRMHKLSGRFLRNAKHLETLDEYGLHALRILAKKLRYSAETFAGLYDRKKVRSFVAALSVAQDVLGKIHDATVARRLLDELAGAPESLHLNEALILAKGWIARERAIQIVALGGVINSYLKQSSYFGF